jgi:hypothetical protein
MWRAREAYHYRLAAGSPVSLPGKEYPVITVLASAAFQNYRNFPSFFVTARQHL